MMLKSFGVIVTLVFTSVAITNVFADEQVDDSVMVLTDDNFDTVMEANRVVLVKFYDPRCGHCKRMAPAYMEAAKKLKEKSTGAILADVDATAQPKLADRFDIRAYPTLKLFLNKKEVEYTGGRSTDAIVEWVANMMGPAVEESTASMDELKTKYKIVFYGAFESKESEDYKAFETFADNNRGGMKFVVNIKAGNGSKIYALHDAEPETLKESSQTLEKFVETNSFPLFGPINGENFKNYADRDLDLVWFCGETAEFDIHKKAIREVSAKNKEYSFVWLDTDQFKGHAEMSLGLSEFPGLVLQTKAGRYVLPDPKVTLGDVSKMVTFFADVGAGKIERTLKSEPVPEKSDEPLKVIVGKNFEDIVLSKDHDVFLEVYAPWCGHCKNFEPIYKDFAKEMLPFTHIVVGKMDGTANESPVEGFDWTGFPTLFWVKAGEKTPMKYDRARTLEDLKAFVKENSSKPLTEGVKPPGEAHVDEL